MTSGLLERNTDASFLLRLIQSGKQARVSGCLRKDVIRGGIGGALNAFATASRRTW